MLIICSGASKSGSTWLFNILSEMTKFLPPPKKYLLDEKNLNPEIDYGKLELFLEELDFSKNNYLIKNHFTNSFQRDLILSYPNVVVFDIDRSLKDVVVSSYFHNLRDKKFEGSFQRYYWLKGRYLADHVRDHHEVWGGIDDERVLVASYENLKENFEEEVSRIGNFLGMELSTEEISRIFKETSLESLRSKYQDTGEIQFFRKGIVGDWKNYISGAMLSDIKSIEKGGIKGLSFYRKNLGRIIKKYYTLFRLAK